MLSCDTRTQLFCQLSRIQLSNCFWNSRYDIAQAGSGTMRSVLCDGSLTVDVVPVNYVVDTLICASWHSSLWRANKLKVYNCTSGTFNAIRWEDGDVVKWKLGLVKRQIQFISHCFPWFSDGTTLGNSWESTPLNRPQITSCGIPASHLEQTNWSTRSSWRAYTSCRPLSLTWRSASGVGNHCEHQFLIFICTFVSNGFKKWWFICFIEWWNLQNALKLLQKQGSSLLSTSGFSIQPIWRILWSVSKKLIIFINSMWKLQRWIGTLMWGSTFLA